MRVWIDQDLCTGDGLCTDHCPEVFVLLEDGISYVRDAHGVAAVPGGLAGLVSVPVKREADVVAAALDCPGDCIFLEPDAVGDSRDDDFAAGVDDAQVVDDAQRFARAESEAGAGLGTAPEPLR